jgi:hypothetical protein
MGEFLHKSFKEDLKRKIKSSISKLCNFNCYSIFISTFEDFILFIIVFKQKKIKIL